MFDRNPLKGPGAPGKNPEQRFPGVEGKLEPEADHGEESYRGSGRLDGLAALVTGGDSGIGRAVAIAFAREGADVAVGYLSDREEGDADETARWVEKAGRRCLLHRFDVRDPDACREFVGRAVDTFGRLDVLVNNAAYQMVQKSVEEITDEQFERTFRTNIFGYFQMVRAALPHMEAGASIINSGSVTGLEGHAGLIDYAATKGAIHNLTKSLAESLKGRGIRVNCVAPGPVWTPLIPSTFPAEDVPGFGEDTYWERPAQPVEIATSYVFLASAESRYYSGEILAPTGRGTTR